MKNKRTMILIYVRTPDDLDHQKADGMRTRMINSIVLPFKCNKRINYSRSESNKDVLIFYIFKEGKLKKSVRTRLIDELDRMHKYWISMLGYSIIYCDGNSIDKEEIGELDASSSIEYCDEL